MAKPERYPNNLLTMIPQPGMLLGAGGVVAGVEN